ncbi:hypothetical protein TNCV_5022341 [Trichonephila clavipes]|nr:hypothetical protein TNCV_5022341 [Trichonephila clavipes]
MLSKKGETTLVHYVLTTHPKLHNKKSFGSQPWRLEQPKKWENWSRAMILSSSPIFLGLNTVSRMFSMGWVPCRGDRYYSRSGAATDIASETHGHSVSFLASASDSDRSSTRRALETRYRAISLHNIHPTPLESIESKWSGSGDHVVSKPKMPNVVTGHVLSLKSSKGFEARNVQRMMMREHFGQQLHNTLFSVDVEVNNLGGCKPLTIIRNCVINVMKSERWTPWYLISLGPTSPQERTGDGRILNVQDGRQFVALHHQVAFHQSHARIETGGKTRGQRRQFGIQNVKHHIGSHELELLRHDWIRLVDRQHIFALNPKGVETFGKFVNVGLTEKSSNVHKSKLDLAIFTNHSSQRMVLIGQKNFEPHDYSE